MSIRNHAVFQKSLIAVAVISLSACSTTPRLPDYDMSQIGERIISAGKSTADLSRRTWDRTTYLLGFSDASPQSQDDQLMDEVDLALLQEDAVLPDAAVTRPVVQQAATVYNPSTTGDTLAQSKYREVGDDEQISDSSSAPELKADQAEDVIHTVLVNENLWQIAKTTTGNAVNWHVLADVNNLAPDAAVFPGQELIIPANMLKQNYTGQTQADTDSDQMASLEQLNPPSLETGELKSVDLDNSIIVETPIKDPVELAATDSERLPIPVSGESGKQSVDTTQPNGTAFTLQPSETLWDLAKRTTGDALNWQTIASQNGFSDEQAVVVFEGQTIYVPDELVRQDKTIEEINLAAKAVVVKTAEPTAVVEPTAPVASNVQVQPVTVPVVKDAVATEASVDQEALVATSQLISESATSETPTVKPKEQLAVMQPSLLDETQPMQIAETSTLDETQPIQIASTSTLDDNRQPIKIVEATYKSDDALKPLTVKEEPELVVEPGRKTPSEIMVSGTYYPKAVYNEADFSSSLLMRVSPGTKLQVSNAMGTWFQVETDKGTGYVHQRDIK